MSRAEGKTVWIDESLLPPEGCGEGRGKRVGAHEKARR